MKLKWEMLLLHSALHCSSMQGQKALGFHQKYLNLCSEDEWRPYRFGTMWGWVINDQIFGWTIPLSPGSELISTLWILYSYSLILLSQFRLLRQSQWMNMNLVGWVIPCHRCWGCLPSSTITLEGSSPQRAAWCLALSPVNRPAWVSPLRTTDFSSRAQP